MAVTSKPLVEEPEATSIAFPELPIAQIVAVVFWLIGTWLTFRVILELTNQVWLAGTLALVIQAACTKLESPIWRRWGWNDDGTSYKRSLSWVNLAVLTIDVGFNIGGVWAVVKHIHRITPIQAIADMLGWQQLQPITGGWAVTVCIILGMIIAAIPEKAWHSAGE